MQHGLLPESEKAAIVTPILKKHDLDPDDVKSYRPISNSLTNPFEHPIALDFYKAFDTVHHSTMIEKFSNFPIPDNVYNWVFNFLSDRCHHTGFNGILSAIAFISASIVQGSVLGPCSFVMEASNLQPQNLISLLLKYADDTDLVVPASHSHTVQVELDGI